MVGLLRVCDVEDTGREAVAGGVCDRGRGAGEGIGRLLSGRILPSMWFDLCYPVTHSYYREGIFSHYQRKNVPAFAFLES